jgi:hypothetical protein
MQAATEGMLEEGGEGQAALPKKKNRFGHLCCCKIM